MTGEFSKRLTPDLGISLGGSLIVLDPDGGSSVNGFDNLEVSAKYVFFQNAEHELLLAGGLAWDVGGTGSKKVDADSFDTWTPQLFFGKGFGDLPDQLELMKPFAITGVFGLAVPSRVHTKTFVTDEDGNVDVKKPLNPTVFQWGFSFQYNLQYLQSYVRDVGLPAPLNRMIPIVEVALQTPLDGRDAGHTTGSINPGIIWFGRYFQLGIEAVIPVNHDVTKNVGALAQIHFYLDDLWPQVFTWTPFHGVLGPTQPQ